MTPDLRCTDSRDNTSENGSEIPLYDELMEGIGEHIQIPPEQPYSSEYLDELIRAERTHEEISFLETYPLSIGADAQPQNYACSDSILDTNHAYNSSKIFPLLEEAKEIVAKKMQIAHNTSSHSKFGKLAVDVKELECYCLRVYENVILYSCLIQEKDQEVAFRIQREVEKSINAIYKDYDFMESSQHYLVNEFSLRNYLYGTPYYKDHDNYFEPNYPYQQEEFFFDQPLNPGCLIINTINHDDMNDNTGSDYNSSKGIKHNNGKLSLDMKNKNSETGDQEFQNTEDLTEVKFVNMNYILPSNVGKVASIDNCGSVEPRQTLHQHINNNSEMKKGAQNETQSRNLSQSSLSTQESIPDTPLIYNSNAQSSATLSMMNNVEITKLLQEYTKVVQSNPAHTQTDHDTNFSTSKVEGTPKEQLVDSMNGEDLLPHEIRKLNLVLPSIEHVAFYRSVRRIRDSSNQILRLTKDQTVPHNPCPSLSEFRTPNNLDVKDVEFHEPQTYSYLPNKKWVNPNMTPYEPRVHRKTRNTKEGNYGLCPYCLPTREQMQKGCHDFFLKINMSNYLHHLTKQHGIFSNGQHVIDPECVVWATHRKAKPGTCIEAVICPFDECGKIIKLSKYDENNPGRNRLLEYLRHVHCSHGEGKNKSRPISAGPSR